MLEKVKAPKVYLHGVPTVISFWRDLYDVNVKKECFLFVSTSGGGFLVLNSHGAKQFLGFFRILLLPCFHSTRVKETVDLIDHIILPKHSS